MFAWTKYGDVPWLGRSGRRAGRTALSAAVVATLLLAAPLRGQAQVLLGPFLAAETLSAVAREALLRDPCFDLSKPGAGAAVNWLNPTSATSLEQQTFLGSLPPAEYKLILWYTEFAGAVLDDYRKLSALRRAYESMSRDGRHPQEAQLARQFQDDLTFLRMQMKWMPSPGGWASRGDAGGYCRLYACRIHSWKNRPVWLEHMTRLDESHKRIAQYEPQARSFLEQGVQGTGDEEGRFRVFRVGRDVLVSDTGAVRNIRACDLAGWGNDCKKIGDMPNVTIYAISRGYDSAQEARDWYCGQLKRETIRVVPLTGGRDRQAQLEFSNGEFLNIQNAPACPAAGSAPAVTNTGPWDTGSVTILPKSALQVCR